MVEIKIPERLDPRPSTYFVIIAFCIVFTFNLTIFTFTLEHHGHIKSKVILFKDAFSFYTSDTEMKTTGQKIKKGTMVHLDYS